MHWELGIHRPHLQTACKDQQMFGAASSLRLHLGQHCPVRIGSGLLLRLADSTASARKLRRQACHEADAVRPIGRAIASRSQHGPKKLPQMLRVPLLFIGTTARFVLYRT